MDFAVFAAASPVIQVHAIAAITAFALAAAQLLGPKGARLHRTLGWTFVAVMGVVVTTAFFIRSGEDGGFSVIHILIPVTVAGTISGVAHARRGNVRRHRNAMLMLFFGALVIAGGFTLSPGRLMHMVVFG